MITGTANFGRQGCSPGDKVQSILVSINIRVDSEINQIELDTFVLHFPLLYFHQWNPRLDAQETVLSVSNKRLGANAIAGKEQMPLSPGLMSAALGLSVPSSKGASIPTSSDRSLKESKAEKSCVELYFLKKKSRGYRIKFSTDLK